MYNFNLCFLCAFSFSWNDMAEMNKPYKAIALFSALTCFTTWCYQVVGLFLLFVLEEEQFICSKRQLFWCTVILITCPSAPLLVVTFVYCYCKCFSFLFVILLTDSFPHIKLVYLVLFSLFKLYSRYPLVSSLWSLMCLCFLVSWIHHYLIVVNAKKNYNMNLCQLCCFCAHLYCDLLYDCYYSQYDITFRYSPFLHILCLFQTFVSLHTLFIFTLQPTCTYIFCCTYIVCRTVCWLFWFF